MLYIFASIQLNSINFFSRVHFFFNPAAAATDLCDEILYRVKARVNYQSQSPNEMNCKSTN